MRAFLALSSVLVFSTVLCAQDATVRGRVNVIHNAKSTSSSADVVVMLTPVGREVQVSPGSIVRLIQKNKQFTPHLLAVTEKTIIEFPNQDPFFHDVFSIYRGKPFDLGLYESGVVKKVVFSKPGVSYIFCNIHPEMSAIVLVTRTPYLATTSRDGAFQMNHVPPGRYNVELWYEFATDSELASLAHQIEISISENILDPINLHSSDVVKQHVNKYGEPYAADKSTY